VILSPGNDEACLRHLVDMARELHHTTLVRDVAHRLGTPKAVIAWLRSLPQSDDDGDERYQFVRCDVPQRTRLFPADPNCFERVFAALSLLEVLEPSVARMPLTIDHPARHTGVVEARGGQWVPLDLFPRRNDSAQTGRDILKGIHNYVGKPLLSFFLGKDTGGMVADTVGGLEDQLTQIGQNKPAPAPQVRPKPRFAPRPQPPRPSVSPDMGAGMASAMTNAATTMATMATTKPNQISQGGSSNEEAQTRGPSPRMDDAPGARVPAASAPETQETAQRWGRWRW